MSDAERQHGETDVAADDPAAPASDATTPSAASAEGQPDAEAGGAVSGTPGQPAFEPQPPGADGDDTATDEELRDLVAPAEADPRSKPELLAELLEAEARRDEYLDDVRRARAEFENYRRRVMREGATQRESGRADVVGPLLEVLDDLDRTLDAAENSADQDLAKGIELVASKLVHALRGVGLERVDAIGTVFDPNQHEAVQQLPAAEPGGDPVVVQVLRPGYRMGDRVLRAAMVVVEQ